MRRRRRARPELRGASSVDASSLDVVDAGRRRFGSSRRFRSARDVAAPTRNVAAGDRALGALSGLGGEDAAGPACPSARASENARAKPRPQRASRKKKRLGGGRGRRRARGPRAGREPSRAHRLAVARSPRGPWAARGDVLRQNLVLAVHPLLHLLHLLRRGGARHENKIAVLRAARGILLPLPIVARRSAGAPRPGILGNKPPRARPSASSSTARCRPWGRELELELQLGPSRPSGGSPAGLDPRAARLSRRDWRACFPNRASYRARARWSSAHISRVSASEDSPFAAACGSGTGPRASEGRGRGGGETAAFAVAARKEASSSSPMEGSARRSTLPSASAAISASASSARRARSRLASRVARSSSFARAFHARISPSSARTASSSSSANAADSRSWFATKICSSGPGGSRDAACTARASFGDAADGGIIAASELPDLASASASRSVAISASRLAIVSRTLATSSAASSAPRVRSSSAWRLDSASVASRAPRVASLAAARVRARTPSASAADLRIASSVARPSSSARSSSSLDASALSEAPASASVAALSLDATASRCAASLTRSSSSAALSAAEDARTLAASARSRRRRRNPSLEVASLASRDATSRFRRAFTSRSVRIPPSASSRRARRASRSRSASRSASAWSISAARVDAGVEGGGAADGRVGIIGEEDASTADVAGADAEDDASARGGPDGSEGPARGAAGAGAFFFPPLRGIARVERLRPRTVGERGRRGDP